jgi:hypothetical protein
MINEKQMVVQSNPLIEARYSLGETEQKLLRVLISMIKPQTDTLENRFHRLSIQDFAQFLGRHTPSSLHKEMRHIARKLREAGVRVIKPNGETIETSWIAGFKYPRNQGWIEFEISSMLESELLRIKEQFTQYYLSNISKLKGEYTTRIYELVRQYANSSLRSRDIPLEELRAILSLPPTYNKAVHLFRRVIIPAHKEITTKTDISFSFRPIKESRKFVAVEFYDIQRKITITPSILSIIPEESRENKELLRGIQKYLELRGPDYVTEKINYAVSRKPHNFADYLFSTMENNYGDDFASDIEKANKVEKFAPGTVFEFGGKRYTLDNNGVRISDTKILNREEIAQGLKIGFLTLISPEKLEQERREAQLVEYEKYRQETIDDHLASTSLQERQAAEENFIQNLDSFSRDVFKERGWNSPIINAMWRTFVGAKVKHFESFEEWRLLVDHRHF